MASTVSTLVNISQVHPLTAGIGKSLFAFFLMSHLAQQKKTLVWEKRNAEYARVLFTPSGAFGGSMACFSKELDDPETW